MIYQELEIDTPKPVFSWATYKLIDTVMANQADLVEVVATLKQVVCIKG